MEVDAMDLGSSLDGGEGEDTEIFRLLFFKDFYSLFNFERERAQARQGQRDREGETERERERERERIPSRPHGVSTDPDAGLDLTTMRS